MKEIIRFSDFTWQYNAQKEPTLHNINLSIFEGEKILITGPSGCGKSTIAHCINGLIPFSFEGEIKGSLKIMDKETKTLSLFDISKIVGTVLQDTDGQFVGLTVAEDIAFALENDEVPQNELFSRVKDAANLVLVGNHLNHAPGELSGGQKQRVSIAGVMVDNVPILLFDEPLANLDPATGKSTIELIDEIHKNTGVTIIIIEHRIEDVLHRNVDRIVLMESGKIKACLPTDEFLCGDFFEKQGIREPLYLTALKYANVKLSSNMGLHSIEDLRLKDEDKSLIKSWFISNETIENTADRTKILSVKNLNFSYEKGGQVIHDITVDFHKGEMLSIVGTNGAGKSTFAKLICGFEKPTLGTICLNGEDMKVFSIKERADHIGYVMQNPNQMISKVMIRDEVGLGLLMRGVKEEIIKEKVEEVLKICGLYPFRNWPISALSYGQKKRVTIASILVLDPKIIILDEPTAGQDYRHYTEIMDFLEDINKNKGITIIMITHDMHLMLEYCKRSVVISGGEIIADTSPAKVLTNPEIIKEASLKETSLYKLASICGIDNADEFCQRFIDYERSKIRVNG